MRFWESPRVPVVFGATHLGTLNPQALWHPHFSGLVGTPEALRFKGLIVFRKDG